MRTSHGSLRTLAIAALVFFTSVGAARALAPIYPHTMRVSQSAHSFTVRWVDGTSIHPVHAEKKCSVLRATDEKEAVRKLLKTWPPTQLIATPAAHCIRI
jgi:hypothetical protein